MALHFATSELEAHGEDGAVICVDYRDSARRLPQALDAVLGAAGTSIATVEDLERICGSLESFDRLADDPFVVFFEPPSFDERIVNQDALFSLMSHPRAEFQAWLEASETEAWRIVIPRELKEEIRDRLDQANISERVLYPGLDGLSTWLRRHYTHLGG